ncbi:MAG TPA: serine hydrolase domain-containing protein [Phaeodactylibacter sp.]|nr:serine hydrolase domain-containing protein [Phaeodactylibacter sp.]
MKSIFLPLTVLLLLTTCQRSTPDTGPDHAAAIQQLEQNLRPAIRIEGEELAPATIHERMAHHKVPGLSIAFFDDGAIQWTRSYGYLSSDSLTAVDENTLFQAASISKPVAASGLLMLVEEGKLPLDSNINDYLKAWQVPDNRFTQKEQVSLRRLLSHTAGLTVHGFRGYAEGEAVPTTLQVLEGAAPANSAPIQPDTMPGSLWRYSGGGYTVAQLAVEDITGKPFPVFMQQRVLGPAGMHNSAYAQPLPAERHPQAAVGHRGDGNPIAGRWHTYPELAAAGLWTTPTDLSRWAIALQQGYNGDDSQFLTPGIARQVLSEQQGNWGLGPALSGAADSLAFSHGGGNEGYRCMLFSFAEKGGQGVVAMTNSDRGINVIDEILISLSKQYGWGRFEPTYKSTIPMTAAEKEQYTGLFRADEQLQIRIDRRGEELHARMLWNDQPGLLYPDSTDRFFDIYDGSTIQFYRQADSVIGGFDVLGYRFEKVGE